MRRLNRKNIYKNSWVKLSEDSVHSMSHGYQTYSLVEIAPGIIVLPIDDKDNTYLVQSYRYAVQKITKEVVNGGIDPGETPQEAAERELKEEAGLVGKNWSSLGVVEPGTSFVRATMHLFIATDLEATPDHQIHLQKGSLVKITLENLVRDILCNKIDHALSGLIGLKHFATRLDRK